MSTYKKIPVLYEFIVSEQEFFYFHFSYIISVHFLQKFLRLSYFRNPAAASAFKILPPANLLCRAEGGL